MEDDRETAEKIIPVTIISKDNALFDASPNDMVEGASGVYTGLAGHILMIGTKLKN